MSSRFCLYNTSCARHEQRTKLEIVHASIPLYVFSLSCVTYVLVRRARYPESLESLEFYAALLCLM